MRNGKKLRNDVRALREDRDITQEGLATALDVTRQTVISIERGGYEPSLSLALDIAGYFGKRVEEIFYADDRTTHGPDGTAPLKVQAPADDGRIPGCACPDRLPRRL